MVTPASVTASGLAHQNHRQTVQLAGDLLGLLLALQIIRLKLRLAGLELLQIPLGRAQRLALRQQKITGEAGPNIDHVAHLAELLDTLEQDDFHILHSSPWVGPAKRRRSPKS